MKFIEMPLGLHLDGRSFHIFNTLLNMDRALSLLELRDGQSVMLLDICQDLQIRHSSRLHCCSLFSVQ